MRRIIRIGLPACAAWLAACSLDGGGGSGGVDLGQVEQAAVVGSFSDAFDVVIPGGGLVVAGRSMSGREDGVADPSVTIDIAGIPAGATVQRALLYWSISGGSDEMATFDGNAITGPLLGAAGSTCWFGLPNNTFRADVTALVPGNGSYVVTDLPSTVTGTDPDTDGVALYVAYSDPASTSLQRLTIRDGAITTDGVGDVVSDMFGGLSVPAGAISQFHIVVGDGQTFNDGNLVFEGQDLGVDQFQGGDGNLWDVATYPVTLAAGATTATWSHTTAGDCLLFVTAAVDVTTLCGDGAIDPGEACDDGNTDAGDGCDTCAIEPGWMCSGAPSTCTEICGDGVIVGGEECDDSGTTSGDGCDMTCNVEPGWTCVGEPSVCTFTCGDGAITGSEVCDDGNTAPNDGCSAVCEVENGWTCVGEPSTCTTTCGDGIPAGTEQCDDGGTTPGDGCDAVCAVEAGWNCSGTPSTCTAICGDGIVVGTEACDDGGTDDGDGCDSTCQVEPGWSCTGEPSTCTLTCGDGDVVEPGEECDDGNTTPNDGCSATCTIEPGWSCLGTTSVCTPICGDGMQVGGEPCDDGNNLPDDGCSITCEIEQNECGNGAVGGSETCDDGNTTAGDGCSATCATEMGWNCSDQPGCVTICGDGLLLGAEACDDANISGGDGCSGVCVLEPGYACREIDGQPSQCDQLAAAGGGCSAGGDGAGGAAVLAILALFGVGRRRRHARVAAIAVVVVATSGIALAQTDPASEAEYPVERFRLAMDRSGILDVESATTPGHLTVDAGIWLGYANDPLTVRIGDDRDREGSLVASRFGGALVGSVGIGARAQLGFTAPLILSQDQDLMDLMGVSSPSSFGFGDIRLVPKFTVLPDGPFRVGVAGTLTLPTASAADGWFGDNGATFAPEVLLGYAGGTVRVGANFGYRLRQETHSLGLVVDDELFAHVGFAAAPAESFEAMASVSLATAAADPFGAFNSNHAEIRGGAAGKIGDKVRVFGALGAGLSEGYGTADWRLLAGVMLGAHERDRATGSDEIDENVVDRDNDKIPDSADKCPIDPESYNSFQDDDGCPEDLDADKDGIDLPADACPAQAESVNGYQDDDGCPDELPDSDKDGIADPRDGCPDNPEDVDGFQDDDGCPDPDNDADGVVDASDRCRDQAGPADNGGCPDADRDNDTVVDRLDNCPDEPGTPKNFGCKEKQLVVFQGSRLQLLDVIYFDTNKATIKKRSNRLLNNIAKVLLAHPEVTRITIEGHTDDKGDDAFNKELSQRRADSVVQFLVKHGVATDKLVPIGYGEEKPVGTNKTSKGRAANRRVEFKLQGIGVDEPAPATQPATPTPP